MSPYLAKQTAMMPVVEVAIITLATNYDQLELYDDLMDCLEAQDNWVQQNKPHLLAGDTRCSNDSVERNLSSPYIGCEDPRYLLITAPWDSLEDHHEWIRSKENKAGFCKLAQHFSQAEDAVTLFHVEPVNGGQGPLPSFMGHACFDVHRILVDPADRKLVESTYFVQEDALSDAKSDHCIWAGWRIEKRADNLQEFVIFSSHKLTLFGTLTEPVASSITVDTLCFRHIA